MARLFAESVRRLGAQLASEHLSFNRAAGDDGPFGSAFFLPPRQTESGVEAAVAAIAALRAELDVPFSFETPVSYLQPRADEIADGAFVAAVAEAADCGILLDLHNIWTNERNGRQSAREFLAQLPLDRVSEVHLAGGLERSGFWLDAHSGGLALSSRRWRPRCCRSCPRSGSWSTRSSPSSSFLVANGPCGPCSNASIDSSTTPAGPRRRPVAARSSPHQPTVRTP